MNFMACRSATSRMALRLPRTVDEGRALYVNLAGFGLGSDCVIRSESGYCHGEPFDQGRAMIRNGLGPEVATA